MTYAVLTGDIVASSTLPASQVDAMLNALRAGAMEIANWAPAPATGFARRGGDGWQVALDQPALAMRAALFLRARLLRADDTASTRIAIATGDGTLPPNGDLNAAHGPAFTASGRALDDIPTHATMIHAAGSAMAAATYLADHIAAGWTQAQARALCEMLPPDSGPRAAAAERLGISRQAVDQALRAAGYPALDAALAALERV